MVLVGEGDKGRHPIELAIRFEGTTCFCPKAGAEYYIVNQYKILKGNNILKIQTQGLSKCSLFSALTTKQKNL